jgi:peroxiredoxin
MPVVQSCGGDEDDGGAAPGKEAAADFVLETFDGGSFRLSDHNGSPVIINFFASWCTLCGVEVSDLEKVYREYAERGVMLVGVAVQDTETKAREYVEKYGLTFPTGLDAEGTVKEAYGVYGLPMTYFIDRKGLVNYVHAGVVTEALLKHELEKIR